MERRWMKHIRIKTIAFILLSFGSFAIAEFDNYFNWPETRMPKVKAEVHKTNKETRVRCQIKDSFRNIQNGLNLSWEFKPCRAGYATACSYDTAWRSLCGASNKPCPPILMLVDPKTSDSGMYRCNITLDSSTITPNIYILQFVETRREPPAIVDGMEHNMTVTTSMAVLKCKVYSPVPPTVRWYRRLHSLSHPHPRYNLIQHFNSTYQLLNCCPVAALPQKDMYLSKLIVTPGTVFESGFYICLAINDANYTFKETFIQVTPTLRVLNKEATTGSFLGLFMIPAVLALIPVTAWMLCLRPRKVSILELPVPSVVTQPALSFSTHLDSSCLSESFYEPP